MPIISVSACGSNPYFQWVGCEEEFLRNRKTGGIHRGLQVRVHLPEEVQPLFHGFGLECFEGIPQNPGQFEGKGYFVLAHLLQSLRTDHLHGTCEPSDEVISASENINHSIDEPGAILMEEIWRQEEDLPRHLRSETYRLVLLVMEMAEGPPEIRFDAITRSGGFEIIEDERMAKKKAPDHS